MLILIVGATGRTGQHIITLLEDRQIPLRALVRDRDVAANIFDPPIDMAEGDLRQPETLTVALSGVSHVICAAGSSTPFGPNRPRHVDYHGVANLARASYERDVEHLLLVSSVMVTKPSFGIFSLMSGNVLKWKARGEEAVRASGVPYTIVRPGGLLPASPEGYKVILDQGDHLRGQIGRPDLAMLCCYLITQAGGNRTFEVVSRPEDEAAGWREQLEILQKDETLDERI